MPRLIGFVGVVLTMLMTTSAFAVPRMSLTAGTPCDACHINGAGGGMRTEIGWGTGAFTGAFMYDEIGLDAVAEIESNYHLDGVVAAGVDVRVQAVRLGRPSTNNETGDVDLPDHTVIPMQLQPYLTVAATDWLTLYGTYNVGAGVFRGQGACVGVYAGTSCFAAMAKIQPDPTWPTLKIGHFQPNIGIRHDDHSMYIRRDASQTAPIIAPNYAEYGGEVAYQPFYWLRADAGVYWANNLARALSGITADQPLDAASAAIDPNAIGWLGRVQFLPQFSDLGVTSWAGASIFGADTFLMQNYFVGLGKKDVAALMLEGSLSSRGEDADHSTFNLMAKADWQIFEWLVLEGRYERATTSKEGQDYLTQAGVVGLQFFPVPYVELRPEYRVTFADEYSMGQFALQLHLFY